jgi:hypothetical protein
VLVNSYVGKAEILERSMSLNPSRTKTPPPASEYVAQQKQQPQSDDYDKKEPTGSRIRDSTVCHVMAPSITFSSEEVKIPGGAKIRGEESSGTVALLPLLDSHYPISLLIVG